MPKGCPNCATWNKDAANFCRTCGEPFADAATRVAAARPDVACPACGHLNRVGARFCAQCGSAQPTPAAAAPPQSASPRPDLTPPVAIRTDRLAAARPPLPIFIGLGAAAILLAVAAVWWFNSLRGVDVPLPPLPPLSAASAVAPVGPASAAEPDSAGAPIRPDTQIATPGPTAASEPAAAIAAAAEDGAADRDSESTLARAQPETATPATATGAAAEAPAPRPRADPARPRAVAAAPRAAAPVGARGPGRSVTELCTASNAALRGICEARECSRRAHAGEALCQRLRAADDRRRQQD